MLGNSKFKFAAMTAHKSLRVNLICNRKSGFSLKRIRNDKSTSVLDAIESHVSYWIFCTIAFEKSNKILINK